MLATGVAAATGVGPVHLSVTDGRQAARFYSDVLGLTALPSIDRNVRFGVGQLEVVVLHPGAEGPVQLDRTGLYHLAIVVPDLRELARVVARLEKLRYPNSPVDHISTKSDYLSDPDGNGIEVYAESPEDGTFGFANGMFVGADPNGNPRSGRDPIDLNDLFAELAEGDRLDQPIPAGSKMGHVHLHVRDLGEAVDFYHDLIGFDVMGVAERIGAAFLSAGGYHHRLGINTWAGTGAPPAESGTAGLHHFTVEVHTTNDLDSIRERLHTGGVEISPDGVGGFMVEDPSRNKALLRARPALNI